ncbi:Ig-like domain-containing protein [Marinicella meishanensis]|uniref:Ig-like domain-containing protein n=1 Tax=Marinicella meishanensis TaxID=2873263 RepID=UPI001CBF0DA3|nr:cadherin-like domain-containing protein [Marinicella sp. NBU2979]
MNHHSISFAGKSLLVACLVFCSAVTQAEVEDNQDYQDAYQAWAGAHFTLLPTSFLPGPIGTAADLASIGIDIRVKTLPASLVAPTPNAKLPNSPDGCHYSFWLPQKEAMYENLLGIADITPLTTEWGAFSDPQPPQVGHANAQVAVRVANEYLEDWSTDDRLVIFPSGNHPIDWSANTQIDPLIDVTIPIALFVITNEIKYFDSFFSVQTDPATAARAAEIGGLFLINAGIEAGLIAAGQIDSNLPIDSAVHAQTRAFTVYDTEVPVITTTEPFPAPLEANSFGGERWAPHAAMFRATITATDPCAQPLLVGNDAPFLLPLGSTDVTWTAVDTGPVGGSNPGFATVVQRITVEDTRPPILLAPPSRVIESSVTATTDDFDVGSAVVFDVADPNPVVTNTIDDGFDPDTRTAITWTATDSSGNADSKIQWVTVKTPGTNTAPQVNDVSDSGLTAEHIDLTLTGSDADLISGLFDPIKFRITEAPANGFFVAPLVPYFIEDYRVRPGDTVGDILNFSNNPSNDLYDAFCDANPPQDIPIDFVYRSEFVHVTDDGTSYVLDKYWYCDTGGSSAATRDRLSKWDADGQWLDQVDITSSVKRITLDEAGFIYAVTPGTSSDDLFMTMYDGNLNSVQNWRLDGIPVSLGNPRLLGATRDSDTGIIYATDKRRVYLFDGADGQFIPAFLGTLKNDENFLSGAPSVAGSSSRGFYIELDSTGAVYVVDSGLDRIHKFEPTTYDGVNLTIGDHIGWLGRCDSGPGCDVPNGRSFGYSCSDATPCEVITANGSNCGPFISGPCSFGSGQGQFDEPLGIAMDPNDMLYVTDYNNSRVQRFTPLGDFAGEAASTCDGSCFVLGDMGMPLDISVNASQFYVLDNDRSLMHVFETAPFKDITNDSVVVTYASDNDFQGVDTFSYRANDGLADSNLGTATLTISRNFREPESFAQALVTDEDNAVALTLLADDPDGIVGVDFNGLDVLTYEVVEGPMHGTLSGNGENRTYTPDADYHGPDAFVFKVNDGVFDSNLATVSIDVQAVNDIPVVQFTDGDSQMLPKTLWPLLQNKIAGDNVQAGLGYPLPLMAEYTDPDAGQGHFLQVSWGDGTIEVVDQTPPADPNNPPDEPLITTTFNSLGQIFGDHEYLSTGMKTIGLTVIDELGGTSVTATTDIEVIPMIDITLEDEEVDEANYPEPGQPTQVVVYVSNQAPVDPIVGLDATNVTFTGTLPDDVQFLNIQTSQGSCSHVDQTSTCDLGTLAPDAMVTITVDMQPDLLFNPAKFGYVVDASSTEPDASYDNLTVLPIPIQFLDEIFLNGFEADD